MLDFSKWEAMWDAYRNAGLPVQGSIADCLCLLGIIGIAVSIPLALSHFAYPKFGTHTVISIVSFILGVASLAASSHMPDHYGTAPEPDELGTRIVRIWGLESIDCDGNLPQRRLPSSDIECTVYRNDRRVHVTIHADDSNRLGLYDTDGKALKPVGKD